MGSRKALQSGSAWMWLDDWNAQETEGSFRSRDCPIHHLAARTIRWRAGIAVRFYLLAIGIEQTYVVTVVAKDQACLRLKAQEESIGTDTGALRENVRFATTTIIIIIIIIQFPSTQIDRFAAAVVQLDPFFNKLALRVGKSLTQAHRGRIGRCPLTTAVEEQ